MRLGLRPYAEAAATFLAPEEVSTDATCSYVAFEPLGVVLAVMPWNFPLWQVFRFAAPALMAGNAGILKHSWNVSGCALALEQILDDAGVPRDVFRALLVGSPRVGGLIEAPEIAAVTLTGSTPAGRAVAEKAGACLKKVVLELGGSDPYVILEDADLDQAAETCAVARLVNGGQSCIAAKRFVVLERVLEPFVGRLVERMARAGWATLSTRRPRSAPRHVVSCATSSTTRSRRSIEAGATCASAATMPDGPGAYYPATVLTDVGPGMAAYEEELFGPVAAIIAARDEPDAIRIANDSIFGLGAAVFTADGPRRTHRRTELEAGACFVNAFVQSDPRLPFGGVKISGYGRELCAPGIREFVNIKTVYLA